MKTLTYVLLGLVCVASLLGTLTFIVWSTSNNYETLKAEHDKLVQEYNKLAQEHNELLQRYNKIEQERKALMENYTKLKEWINQTEYAVRSSLSISGDERLEVKCEVTPWGSVRVNVTNVGNEPIQKVFVFLVYSHPLLGYTYQYETIHDLWMGEKNTVSFYSVYYDVPFKVFAVGYP
jgi:hypothetical protein